MSERPRRQSHRRVDCTSRSAYWMIPVYPLPILHMPLDFEASGGSTMRFSSPTEYRRLDFEKASTSMLTKVSDPKLRCDLPIGPHTIGTICSPSWRWVRSK